MSLRIVIVCAICLMALSIASASAVSIPLNSVKKPAVDLISAGGQPLDVGQAARLAGQGQDLSLLNPQENKLWQNKTYAAVEEGVFPTAERGVRFLSDEAANPDTFTYMGRVQSLENPSMFYRFSLSRYAHTTLMRAALLRKLGYFVPSPKHYRNLRVYFASEEEKTTFLASVESAMSSDLDVRGWILDDNKTNHSLAFSDSLLEKPDYEYFDVYWGYGPNPRDPDQLPAVQRYSRYRAYRALILPFVLVDLPESVNRFSPKMGSVLSGNVVMNHVSAESFAACTFEDARWLARRMQAFSPQDFQEIVKAGAFPPELEPLILAKLYYRALNTLELFNLPNSSGWPRPSLDISSPSGLVKNGKVTKEGVPGYPQRFAHGDRPSPFTDGDLQRYLGIRFKNSLLATAIAQINDKLNLLKVSDLYVKRGETIRQRIIDHIRTNPREPLYQPVEAWGGPMGGFSMNAGRQVTTGTYYGSSAAIQLVDNLSLTGNIGYFMALDGLPTISPMGGANLVVTRDYTHVRPLLSITEGTKVDWKDLVIPRFMNKLAAVLDQKDPAPVEKKEGDVKNLKDDGPKMPIDAFLLDLRENEVFTITDSVALATYAQISTSMDTLMGIAPLSFMNSVTLSADGSRVILRQTSFMRTKEGIQVFIRSQNSTALGMTLDFNYFINLLKIRGTTSITNLHTDAFVIDYSPGLSAEIDPKSDQKYVKDFIATRNALKTSLRALFRNNDPELLYSKFQYKMFAIDHNLKTSEMRTRMLAERLDNFTEEHLLKIRYPKSEDAPELNPQDEEVTLFASKKGELVGRDVLGFALDWVTGVFNKWKPNARVDLANSDDPNPANTPFGKAYWRLISTEADLTKNGTQYPSVSVLQHVWGGWHLNRNDFLKLLGDVQGQFQGTKLASYRLIEPEAFANVKSIDFYRITANLSVLPGGLDKIRDLITQPASDGKSVEKAKFLGRLFQKLSEKMGNKARAGDMEMFSGIVTILGNGNYQQGLVQYQSACNQYFLQKNDWSPTYNGQWVNGTYYDCLMPWVQKLLNVAGRYPQDKALQTRWMSEVLYILDEQIPLPQLLKFLGEENYIFLVRVNGFRTGDEDGDLEYFSNTLGDPKKDIDYGNGLINMFATKTRISPLELDRTQGGFK